MGRGVDELEFWQRRRAALAAELVERPLQRAERPRVLGAIVVPARAVRRRVAGEGGRDERILELGRVAGDDPHPGDARRRQGGEGDHVVLDDRVGADLVDDLDQALVDVAGAVAQRLEGGGDEALELLDRGLAEHRGRVADEVLPELAGVLGLLRGRREPHQALLEPLLGERALERLLGDEHHAVPAAAEHVADPDAVVRRPVGALGKEGDRRHGVSVIGVPAPAV